MRIPDARAKQLGSQLLGVLQREVAQGGALGRRAGHLRAKLGQPEESGQHWLRDVHRLQTGQLDAALVAHEQPGVDPQVAIVVVEELQARPCRIGVDAHCR